MKKSDTPNTGKGCAGVLIFLFAMLATAFGFWRLGYRAGSQDTIDSESAKLFSMQWTSSIKMKKADFMQKINDYRKEHGAQALRTSLLLEKSAEAAAYEIFIGKRGWNHDGYVASISGQYQSWWIIGENLARNYNNFDFVLTSWEHSPEHNANLLEKDYCEGGLGVYAFVWVLHLGCRN